MEKHPDMDRAPIFTYKVSRVCKTALERQIWESIEIQTSNTQVVLNQKGEWGSNLPPIQATTVQGEIWHSDKGKKRSGGRPPEPPDLDDLNNNNMSQNQHGFHGQFRQRKRRKLAARAQQGDQENQQTQSQSNHYEQSMANMSRRADPGSRSV